MTSDTSVEQDGLLPGVTRPLNLYLGGKMLGVPGFGFTDFDDAAASLRALGHNVFNPAERDRGVGLDTTHMAGTIAELEHVGFSRREALTADMEWIGKHSDGMIVLPTWPDSPGTRAEMGFHYGLYLPVWELRGFLVSQAKALPLPVDQFHLDVYWHIG